jgi:hypothetical protein
LLNIDFSYNYFNAPGIRAIAAISRRLQNFYLEGLQLDDADVELLVSILRRLQQLSLVDNQITDKGAGVIAKALIGTQLQLLDLEGNAISDQGAMLFGEVLQNTTLQKISFAFNEIHAAGAITFASRLQSSQLQEVVFSGNTIGSEGGLALANSIRSLSLKSLNLAGCGLTDNVLVRFADNLPQSPLENLGLAYNHLQNTGAEALANILTTVTSLRSQEWVTNIDRDVRRALAKGKPNTHLKSLDLAGNEIAAEGAKALCFVLPQTEIDVWRLNLADNPINPQRVDINNCLISSAASVRARTPYQILYNLYLAVFPAKLVILQQFQQALPPPSVTPRSATYWDIGILLFYLGIIIALIYATMRISRSDSDCPLSYFFKVPRGTPSRTQELVLEKSVCSETPRITH